MSIAHVRETIRFATWLRRDLEGGTEREFIANEDIGRKLSAAIADMKALDIPKRFAAEHMLREAEIGACEDTIRRWLKARGQSYLIARVDPPKIAKPDEYEVWVKEEPTSKAYTKDGKTIFRVIDGGKKS